MANRIDLVRHPDKKGDAEGIYLGKSAAITDKGWREAAVVVERLKRLPHDVIMTSEITRAIELAEMYARELNYREKVMQYPFFNEIDKPQWLVGLKRKDPIHVEVMQIIRDCFDSGEPPMLSPRLQEEIFKRLGFDLPLEIAVKGRRELEEDMMAIFDLFDGMPEETGLVVSHAKLIAAIQHWIEEKYTLKTFYEKGDQNILVDTTGITTLIKQPDRRTGELRWFVLTRNDISHYEEAKHNDFLDLLKKL